MQMMEITEQTLKLSELRITGLLYVVISGTEYQTYLVFEKIDLHLVFRASLVAVVNSGWIKSRSSRNSDLPSESYVRTLPQLQASDYHFKTLERYFLTVTGRNRVGVEREEYLNVQYQVIGTEDFDPFLGPEPVDFENEHVIGRVEVWKDFVPPTLDYMAPFPAESNPFHYDHSNMGCAVSGGWYAMYNQHAGNNLDGKPYPDPKYIVMVNSRTGQRFKLVFPVSTV